MRILFILGSPHANYLEDLVLSGLVATLGPSAVDYLPAKDHFAPATRPHKYPERTCWPPIALPPPIAPASAISSARACAHDYILFGTPREAQEAALMEDVRDATLQSGAEAPRMAMINGEDRVAPRIMEAVLPNGPWFIREIAEHTLSRLPRGTGGEVIPLPLCYNAVDLPVPTRFTDRDIDTLWIGAAHHGRARYIEALRGLPFATVVTDPLPHGEYVDLLRRSRSVVVLHGAGQHTYRLFEAMAHGCIPVWQDIAGFDPLMGAGEHVCLAFADPGEMLDELYQVRALATKTQRDLADDARSALVQYHTHTARAAHVLDWLARVNTA